MNFQQDWFSFYDMENISLNYLDSTLKMT